MDFIQINNKDLPIKFTYSTLMMLEKTLKKPFTEIANDLTKGNMTLLVEIAHAGFRTGARIEKEKYNLTLEQLGDELTPDLVEHVTKLFGEAFAPAENTENQETAEAVKN